MLILRPVAIVRNHKLLTLLLLGLLQTAAMAQEAWLVTYGPGEDVWERFGHNALWLRDAEAGLDHTFSFGYFEMDRPGFHRDFARGIMLYFGAAGTPEREFEFYRQRDRSISVQQLNLDADQFRHLYRLLDEAIFPEPQYYHYDYYFANCSTWLRDLLDEVLDGELARQWKTEPAVQNFRDHTRRLTEQRFWLHTGMMLLLGPLIDHERNAWEEGFLPASLAQWADRTQIAGEPLVLHEQVLYAGRSHRPPATPQGTWLNSLAIGLVLALLIAWPGLLGSKFRHRLPWRLGLLAAGIAGTLVLLMWLASGHEATWRNGMVLLLNPLWLIFLAPGMMRGKRASMYLLLASLVAGSIVLIWPTGQYRLDQVFLVVPMLGALLLVTAKQCRLP